MTLRACAACILLTIGIAAAALAQEPLVSGKPLKVGIHDGVGLLSSPNAYKTIPLGCGHVFGGKRPDVFINATRGIDQDLLLYRWLRDNEQGQPVFAPPVKIKHPFGQASAPQGTIVEDSHGIIHGFWFVSRQLIHCEFDRDACEFKRVEAIQVKGLPRQPGSIGVLAMARDRFSFAVTCSNGAHYQPPGDTSSEDYVLYDGAGAFRGEWPYCGVYGFEVAPDLSKVLQPPRLISRKIDEIRGGSAPLTQVSYPNQPSALIAGSILGGLYIFPRDPSDNLKLREVRTLFGPGAYSIRHPTQGATPIVYPDRDGQNVDLLVGGEGALFYYRFCGKFDAGHPIYGNPEPVWQEDALLFAGTLPVPSVFDWDGDGAADLIVGNSEGLVLLFKNFGSNREPKFGIGQPLQANHEIIHVQPGYHGIQGPFEARWGYTCPTVADWNGDGLPDILLSSATARHDVLLNIGTAVQPQLAAPHPIYFDGLELHGMWRVRPGVARIDGRMAYIIQDDANALHLFWRIDTYNVEDGGQLKLTTGKIITSHITGTNTGPGQRGRAKIEVVDWDRDGKFDLLIGTAKRGSFPQPDTGLPWSRRRHGTNLQVIFMRNVGTNAAPVYEYPQQLQFRGSDIYLGAHANAPVVCPFGDTSAGPNLLIGMEAGRIYFFNHNDITFLKQPPPDDPAIGK